MAKEKAKVKSATIRGSNLDKLREAFNSSSSSGDNARWWKPEWGDNTIRVLPPIDPDGLFFHETARHRVDEDWFQCLAYQLDEETGKPKKCPICEARKRFYRAGDPALIDIAKKIKAKLQYLMNIVVVSSKKGDEPKQVLVYGAGIKLWKKLMKDMLDDELDITDVVDGYDFTVSKEEGPKTDLGTFPNYDSSKIKRKSTPLAETDEEIEEILGQRIDLESIPRFDSEATLKDSIDKFVKTVTNTDGESEFYDDDNDSEEPEVDAKEAKAKVSKFKDSLKAKLKSQKDDD